MTRKRRHNLFIKRSRWARCPSPRTRNTWIIGRAESTFVAAYATISRESSCGLHQNVSTLQVRCNLERLYAEIYVYFFSIHFYFSVLFESGVAKIFPKLCNYLIYLFAYFTYYLFIYI